MVLLKEALLVSVLVLSSKRGRGEPTLGELVEDVTLLRKEVKHLREVVQKEASVAARFQKRPRVAWIFYGEDPGLTERRVRQVNDSLELYIRCESDGIDYLERPMQLCVQTCNGMGLTCDTLKYKTQEMRVRIQAEQCQPGQHVAHALALPQKKIVQGTLAELRALAGPGAYDETSFTVEPIPTQHWRDPNLRPGILTDTEKSYSQWHAARIYTTGGDFDFLQQNFTTTWERQYRLLSTLFPAKKTHFLEFGCGTAQLASWLLATDFISTYACVEPNEWLLAATLDRAEQQLPPARLHVLLERARGPKDFFLALNARFSTTDLKAHDFVQGRLLPLSSAPSPPEHFDLIYSHSVLSHAGSRQLYAYFRAAANVLSTLPHGFLVASLCLCSPCGPGSRIHPPQCDSDLALEWVYPETSFHSPRDIESAAAQCGLSILHLNDQVTRLMRRGMRLHNRSPDWHDWLIASNRPNAQLPYGFLQRLEAWGNGEV